MQATQPQAQITTLFPNALLARVERLRIQSMRRFTSKHRGEHLHGKGGLSTEFTDYRDYSAGDDVRFVDWNVFARLNRPYLKLYEQEEEMHVVALVDASASMGFEGKLERAKQLAAAFGVMGLLGQERVSVWSFNSTGERPGALAPCTGRASMAKLLRHVEGIEAGGDEPVEGAIEDMLRFHYGRGVALVLSDFLTFGSVRRALTTLYSSGLEVLGVQILGPAEIDPELTGDLRLVDSESEFTLDVSNARELLRIYRDYRLGFQRELETVCKQRGGRFLSISSAEPLESVLFDVMLRRGWVR